MSGVSLPRVSVGRIDRPAIIRSVICGLQMTFDWCQLDAAFASSSDAEVTSTPITFFFRQIEDSLRLIGRDSVQ
jgi:hypothetical protein